ncbi:putative aldo-keto reductase [Microdochium trichocladiopsis]|uniref:Aldo-keto reductase n=1 Tax=Microdochium trichocladiopsis TaxID=1682393 RepID=A0A9P8Y6P7_9PEZI|nr:putative aldo-keto reductase [Microdochium trichocladiopsis]KAH7029077.1 putative aldo-keto reductase [Microdochium trichocladiopsis]
MSKHPALGITSSLPLITATNPDKHSEEPGREYRRIPILGLGVYRIKPSPDGVCQAACRAALEAGYRHIDTARLYRNEPQVCRISTTDRTLSRKDIFLTTKIRESTGDEERDYKTALKCVERLAGTAESCVPYVDLLLIHQPPSTLQARKALWHALERLQREGRARSIGVSNYRIEHIEEMKTYARNTWPPCVNQIEVHPWFQQAELTEYCASHGIVVEAFAPLAQGKYFVDNKSALVRIARKHGKTRAQVLIRWSLQKGFVALPKSSRPERIRENADVFDFELDGAEMSALGGLDHGGTAGATYKWNKA